jgi:hypothetical protein
MLLSIIFMGILITHAGDIRHLLGQGLEKIFRGRYAHFFKGPSQTTPTGKMTATASDEILQLQRSLKKFGYSTLPLDGIWGEQTLTAVQQFRDDYFLELRVDDITEITRALQRQRAIITLHPDWPRIAKDPRFRLWTRCSNSKSTTTKFQATGWISISGPQDLQVPGRITLLISKWIQ